MIRFILFLILILSLCACGKRAATDFGGPVKTTFGVDVSDGKVAVNGESDLLKSALDGPQGAGPLTVESKDWLELADQYMETGAAIGGDFGSRLSQAGENLSRAFYSFPNGHTIMTGASNPVGNPWTEAAYYYGKPDIVKNLVDGLDSAENKVKAAAAKVKIETDDLGPSPLPENLIQRVIDGLNKFGSVLAASKDGTGDSFIDQITATVGDKYLKDLETLRDSAKLAPPQPLSASLTSLASTLSALPEITETDRRRLLIQVRLGISLASQMEAVKDSPAALGLLIDFWTAKSVRAAVPSSVSQILSKLTDKQILALATGNKKRIFSNAKWNSFKDRVDYNLVPDKRMVALFLSNNGVTLTPFEWSQLQTGAGAALQTILNSPEVVTFTDNYSVDYPVDPKDRVYILIDNWLNLSGRISCPASVKTAFQSFTAQDLTRLSSDPSVVNGTTALALTGHEELAYAHYELLGGIETFGAASGAPATTAEQGVQNFKDFFTEGIKRATRARIDSAMIPIAADFSQRLEENIVPALEDQIKAADKTASDTYRIYSRYYLGKLIFGAPLTKGSMDDDPEPADNRILAENPLPLLEKNQLRLVKSGNHYVDEATEDITSPQVLGAALINNIDRLWMPNSNSRDASALAFELISKLMLLGGYKGYDSSLVAGLSVPMTSGHSGARMDIRNYDPSQIVFAAPDVMKIQNQFRLDPSSEHNPTASVSGQMELLHAYAQALKYFKPWHPSPFNLGLGAFRIDEEPTLDVFDPGDYFLLSLGLSIVVLKNIPAKMLGLITDKNKFVESSTVPDPTKVQAIGAVLADYTPTGMSTKISTGDLAKGILALSEFYEQIEDLNRSTNPTIVSTLKTQSLQDALTNIHDLASGLIIFSTGRLMGTDGGFAPSFDADEMKTSSAPRNLQDQLLMEKALLEAGRIFGSDFIKAEAVENLFFLNSHFWNTKLGFYNETEGASAGSSNGHVRLINVALALQNAYVIKNLLPETMTQSSNLHQSSTQLDELMNLWEQRFFSGTLDLPPVEQVFEFSL